jgi:hypothetical protein
MFIQVMFVLLLAVLIRKALSFPSLREIMMAQNEGRDIKAKASYVVHEGDFCPCCKRRKLSVHQFEVKLAYSYGSALWYEFTCRNCGVVDQQPFSYVR